MKHVVTIETGILARKTFLIDVTSEFTYNRILCIAYKLHKEKLTCMLLYEPCGANDFTSFPYDYVFIFYETMHKTSRYVMMMMMMFTRRKKSYFRSPNVVLILPRYTFPNTRGTHPNNYTCAYQCIVEQPYSTVTKRRCHNRWTELRFYNRLVFNDPNLEDPNIPMITARPRCVLRAMGGMCVL